VSYSHACTAPRMVNENTYGNRFVSMLCHTRAQNPLRSNISAGRDSCVARSAGRTEYALEGSIFTRERGWWQWLRDGLGIQTHSLDVR